MKCVLSIAGSDSGGGAGIQADLKTFAALGLHGATAITSVTAQNTLGVRSVHNLPVEVIEAQIDAIMEDLHIKYAKTGMLPTPEIARAVAGRIRKHGLLAVVDPVMAAEAGGSLMQSETLQVYKKELIPLAWVVTPNIREAQTLTDIEIVDIEDAVEAAQALHGMGARAVVVTGGHLDGRDVLVVKGEPIIIEGTLISTEGTHGGGCTFSAAIAAYLALGSEVEEAVRGAKRFTTEAIRRSESVGAGQAPVDQLGELLEKRDRL